MYWIVTISTGFLIFAIGIILGIVKDMKRLRQKLMEKHAAYTFKAARKVTRGGVTL